MEKYVLRILNRYISELKHIQAVRTNRLNNLDKYTDVRLKYGTIRGKKIYYKGKYPDKKKPKYLGNQSNVTVRRIQEARYLGALIDVVDNDIKVLEKCVEDYESISFEHINSLLPNIYKNKYAEAATGKKRVSEKWKRKMEEEKLKYPILYPGELTQPTIDGKYVRTKSEALIYNALFEAGYTFVYELPLEGERRLFYPDFSILSEIDYQTIIRIEHQGMMGDETYRDRAEAREYDYWIDGYLPNRDVYFTYDDRNGKFDFSPIAEILMSRVRPMT